MPIARGYAPPLSCTKTGQPTKHFFAREIFVFWGPQTN